MSTATSPLGSRYWRLLAATGASALGDGMVFVAFPLLALTMTKDPVLIAGVAVAGQLPWLLLALPAGAFADRADRRRLVVQVEIFRAVVLAAFAASILTGHRTLVGLYGAALLVGACETAFWAATNASLPALVGRDALPHANGYLLAADTAGEQFAGPAAGGLLYAWAAAAPFIGDALSFVVSALLLYRVIPSSPARAGTSSSLLADVRTGLNWFVRNPLMRLLAGVIATFAFCQAVILGVLVLYGVRVLHLSKGGYGLFLALAAAGNVVGGVAAGRVHRRLGPRWTIVCAGFLAAAGYVVLSRTSLVAVAVAGVAIQALGVAVGNVATLSVRQAVIPGELLGRVNNIFRTCVWGMLPIGALVGGVLASHVGLHTTFLMAGALQAAVVLAVIGWLGRRIREEPALHRHPYSASDEGARPSSEEAIREAESLTVPQVAVEPGGEEPPRRRRPLVAEGRDRDRPRQRPLVARGRAKPADPPASR